MKRAFRKSVYAVLEQDTAGHFFSRLIDLLLIVLIAANIIVVSLETIPQMHARYADAFWRFELFSVLVFTAEYLLRLWSCVEDERLVGRRFARLRFASRPMALIDLLAILPFYLSFMIGFDLRVLRVLRLMRIFKLTRYFSALAILLEVLRAEAHALLAGIFIMIILLVLVSSGAYLVEHEAQPEKFGSIPAAMWWAVATLTTVGYGDVTPITPLGKFFGACVTIVGVGMAALPAGILASGLTDYLRMRREHLAYQFRVALEDQIVDASERAALEALRLELGLSKRDAQRIYLEVTEEERQHARRQAHPLQYCPQCGASLTEPGSRRSHGKSGHKDPAEAPAPWAGPGPEDQAGRS